MLKIALIGAPHTGKSRLASGLNHAIKAWAWTLPITIVILQAQDLKPSSTSTDYNLVLLTGLEENLATHHSLHVETTRWQAQKTADRMIRTALVSAKISYQVLYGHSDERLAQACHALQRARPNTPVLLPLNSRIQAAKKPPPWVWFCDKCSDPQCEHRLLTALLAQRARRA